VRGFLFLLNSQFNDAHARGSGEFCLGCIERRKTFYAAGGSDCDMKKIKRTANLF
jgi:hypothetical protein